jgi:hypothetical protein
MSSKSRPRGTSKLTQPDSVPAVRRKSQRRDSDTESQVAATVAAAEAEEAKVAAETRQAAIDAGIIDVLTPSRDLTNVLTSESEAEEEDQDEEPSDNAAPSITDPDLNVSEAESDEEEAELTKPPAKKQKRSMNRNTPKKNFSLSTSDLATIVSLVSKSIMDSKPVATASPLVQKQPEVSHPHQQETFTDSNHYFSNWNATPSFAFAPPRVSAPPNIYYSTASAWTAPLLPLPQSVVDDTANGKYVHISQYYRNTLAKVVSTHSTINGHSGSAAIGSNTARSNNVSINDSGKIIHSWDDIAHAYIHGLLPASCAAPNAPQDRETDLLRFFSRLSHYNSQFGWQQTLNYCESIRIVNMGRHPTQYRLCELTEYTQQLYITMLAQQRSHINSHPNPRSAGERNLANTPNTTSRHTSGICRLYNEGACHRTDCRYKHYCLDCSKPNVRRGHSGCASPTAETDMSKPSTSKKDAATPGGPSHNYKA